jgi:hypothetical protein
VVLDEGEPLLLKRGSGLTFEAFEVLGAGAEGRGGLHGGAGQLHEEVVDALAVEDGVIHLVGVRH